VLRNEVQNVKDEIDRQKEEYEADRNFNMEQANDMKREIEI